MGAFSLSPLGVVGGVEGFLLVCGFGVGVAGFLLVCGLLVDKLDVRPRPSLMRNPRPAALFLLQLLDKLVGRCEAFSRTLSRGSRPPPALGVIP